MLDLSDIEQLMNEICNACVKEGYAQATIWSAEEAEKKMEELSTMVNYAVNVFVAACNPTAETMAKVHINMGALVARKGDDSE